jgi:hypothetical protein
LTELAELQMPRWSFPNGSTHKLGKRRSLPINQEACRSIKMEVTMKVLEALAAAIAAEGIDHIFAVMGDANQDILVELCEKHGLEYVHAHHETSAVGMADGYSRFSGKIGLASTTQGPGYTNATTSLVLARLHRSPVLTLAGHASLRDPYNPQGMVDQQKALAEWFRERRGRYAWRRWAPHWRPACALVSSSISRGTNGEKSPMPASEGKRRAVAERAAMASPLAGGTCADAP